MYKYDLFNWGVLALRKRRNIDAFIVSDSTKKKLFKLFVRLGPKRVSSTVSLEKLIEDEILQELRLDIHEIEGIYLKAQRKPKRKYLWFNNNGVSYFCKIGYGIDLLSVEHEKKQIRKFESYPNIKTFPIIHHKQLPNSINIVVYTSIPVEKLRKRRMVSTKKIRELQRSAILHPDVNSENVFQIDNELYFVDLEPSDLGKKKH